MAHKLSALDLANCLTDPNILLSKALANRNIEDFRIALELGAHPLATDYDYSSIFEKALKTSGCVEFVQECFKAGCSPNHVFYHKKRVIIFASESQDPQIINAVLSHKEFDVNCQHEVYPLNVLAESLNKHNFDNVFKCMQIMLQFGFTIKGDYWEKTPLDYIVQNFKIDELKKLEIVKLFLSQPDLDIDTVRSGQLRAMMAEKYPDLKLPLKHENHRITYPMLSTHIRLGDMDKFKQQFLDSQRNTCEHENEVLLRESIVTEHHLAFDLLLQSGVNYNQIYFGQNLVLKSAICSGNWYALETLLQQPDIQIDMFNVRTSIDLLIRPTKDGFRDYRKCFDILLNSNKIDINRVDINRNTALHYAVKMRCNEAIKQLLQKGADIRIKNYRNEFPIEGMNPEILEEHFDNCISSKGEKSGDYNYLILINFRNLRPDKNQDFHEDMAPIVFMAKNKKFHRLLQHPVITTYLFLKWQKLSMVFYVNFILYLFYVISFISYVVLKFRLTDHITALAIMEVMTWLGISYLAIRETIQFIMCPQRYFRSFTNLMEAALIILSGITCIEHHLVNDAQREIAVVAILFASVEISQLVGSLPVMSISTHMLMLEAVGKSFLKSFIFYTIFVITFTLCFYIMSDHEADPGKNEKAFNLFYTPIVAFSKTMVMLTGELEASDLKLDFFPLIIFLIFIIVMPIIMMNLLNGLAVNDTQEIKAQAELNFFICRIKLLTRYEQLFTERAKLTKLLFNRPTICAKLFPEYTNKTDSQISILPNKKNIILLAEKITEQDIKSKGGTDSSCSVNIPLTVEDKEIKRQIPGCFFCIFRKYAKIDYRTVQLANTIIERKFETNMENSLEQKQDELLKRMSDQLAIAAKERMSKTNIENRLQQKQDEILKRMSEQLTVLEEKSETNMENHLKQDELLKLMSEQLAIIVLERKSETNMENRLEQKLDDISERMLERLDGLEQKSKIYMEYCLEQKLDDISERMSERLDVLEQKSKTNMEIRLEQKLDELLKRMSEQKS